MYCDLHPFFPLSPIVRPADVSTSPMCCHARKHCCHKRAAHRRCCPAGTADMTRECCWRRWCAGWKASRSHLCHCSGRMSPVLRWTSYRPIQQITSSFNANAISANATQARQTPWSGCREITPKHDIRYQILRLSYQQWCTACRHERMSLPCGHTGTGRCRRI